MGARPRMRAHRAVAFVLRAVLFLCTASYLMDVLEGFLGAVAPGGAFDGTSFKAMMVLLTHLTPHDTMRAVGGRPSNKTQLRMLRENFCSNHDISASQYECLLDLYSQSDMADVYAAMQATPATPGAATPYVRRFFQSPHGPRCCNYGMKVREVQATAYSREGPFRTIHVVKHCVGSCSRTYYLNKKTSTELLDANAVTTHTFYPWSEGDIPAWVANKSGKAIISSALLSDFAIAQCTLRAGFNSYSALYNTTVGRGSPGGTAKLRGDVLEQCWETFCVLKMANGVGPFAWIPLEGQELTAQTPSELDVFDTNKGQQSGVNFWPGLRAVTARFMTDYWPNSVWMNHACSDCRRDIDIDGTVHPIQACCVDGCTSARWFKCHVKGCESALTSIGRLDRYCPEHELVHGQKCAFWKGHPSCNKSRQAGRLSCPDHAELEAEYNRRNGEGTWTAQQRARARKEMEEPANMKYLRGIYGRRTSMGVLTASWTCGIITGVQPLHEAEGMEEVVACLFRMFPDVTRRPAVLFYDTACALRRYLILRAIQFLSLLVVDRFHFRAHREMDCAEYNSPEHKDNRMLWHLDDEGNPHFNFNSSMAESNNAWLSGFKAIVMRMPRTLGEMVINTNATIKNELLMHSTLIRRRPTFNP